MESARCKEGSGYLEKGQPELREDLCVVDTTGNQAINHTYYERNGSSVLGENILTEVTLQKQVQASPSRDFLSFIFSRKRHNPKCFNCGDERHKLSTCSLPRNVSLIALSRAMYEFFRSDGTREQDRLHEHAERILQRKHYNSAFEPGIVGQDLLNALGFRQGKDLSCLPWYPRMLEWGYPPGWLSVENPKDLVEKRIENVDLIENVEVLQIFRSDSPSSGDEDLEHVNSQSIEENPGTSRSAKSDIILRRWANYTTPLFSSELLAVYSGDPLCIDKIKLDGLHPWRCPGAFSAFGPAGWRELVRIYDLGTKKE